MVVRKEEPIRICCSLPLPPLTHLPAARFTQVQVSDEERKRHRGTSPINSCTSACTEGSTCRHRSIHTCSLITAPTSERRRRTRSSNSPWCADIYFTNVLIICIPSVQTATRAIKCLNPCFHTHARTCK